jgi:type II secretory pathway pseudopilin PulG
VRVNQRETKANEGRQVGQRGFSVTELMVVVVIGIVLTAAAMMQLNPALQQQRANAGADEVKSTLRLARETAVSDRRTVQVTFTNKNTISLYELAPGTTTLGAAFLTVPIEGTVQFMTFQGETDTPDGFSPTITVPDGVFFAGVDGGPTSGMMFQSDGTFTNGNGTPINGTVFLGVLNVTSSMRAVTVLGNTGRVTLWRVQSTGTTTTWF